MGLLEPGFGVPRAGCVRASTRCRCALVRVVLGSPSLCLQHPEPFLLFLCRWGTGRGSSTQACWR